MFNCIVADPPWRLDDDLPGPKRGASKFYTTLDTISICNLSNIRGTNIAGFPISDTAILFMWRLSSLQRECLEVIEKWGFNLKSEMVWVKQTTRGYGWFGMGNTVRASHETCVIATRGKYRSLIEDRGIRSVFYAKVPTTDKGKYVHSAKPALFFDIVEQMVPSTQKLELFARQRRPGWTTSGDQIAF